MRTLLLKALATGLTMLTAAGSASYVGAHLKNASAPLHPAAGGSAYASGLGGRLALGGSVHIANVEAVTSTYAS